MTLSRTMVFRILENNKLDQMKNSNDTNKKQEACKVFSRVTHPNFRFKEESTLLTYQHIFFRKQVSRKTRFIVYGLSRINRIIKDRVVFNLGPKLRNGPKKRFGFFSIHFFSELVLKLAVISKTQVK